MSTNRDNLENLVQQYADELFWIERWPQHSSLEKNIYLLLQLRDQIEEYLQDSRQDIIDKKIKIKINKYDKKLKYLRNCKPLQPAFKNYYDHRSSNSYNKRYWWQYKALSHNKSIQTIMARDNLWSFVAIIFLSITIILIISIFLKFVDVNSGFFQTLAIAVPALITIFVGEGLLTKAGEGWFDNFINVWSRYFYCLNYNRGFLRLCSASLVLLITFVIGLSFPRIAHQYYFKTGINQCQESCQYIAKKIDSYKISTKNSFVKSIRENFMNKTNNKTDLDAAIRNLNYALKIDLNDDYQPNNNEIHYYLGKVYQQVRDFDNAHFNYKLAYRGGYEQALTDIAELYLEQKNYSKAADVLYKATEYERLKKKRGLDYSLTLQQIDIAQSLIDRYLFDQELQSYSEAFKWIRLIEYYRKFSSFKKNFKNFNKETYKNNVDFDKDVECIIYKADQQNKNKKYKCYNYETEIQKIWLAIKQNHITTNGRIIDLIEEAIDLNQEMNKDSINSKGLSSESIKNPKAYCLRAQVFEILFSDFNNQIGRLKNDIEKILIQQQVDRVENIENKILGEKVKNMKRELKIIEDEKKKMIKELKKSFAPPSDSTPAQCTEKAELLVYQLWQQCNFNLSLSNAQEQDWRAMYDNYKSNLSKEEKKCGTQLT